MRVLVCGSRGFTNQEYLFGVLDALRSPGVTQLTTIVEGCASRGADKMAEQWAQARGIEIEHYPADWKTGKGAGFSRNKRMIESKPDYVVAFYADPARPSNGTAHTVGLAEEAAIPVILA
jgi:hypothetical protein